MSNVLFRGKRYLRVCGAKRNRTADLFIANEALYQLSYSPCAGRKYTQSEGMASNALAFLAELRRRSTNRATTMWASETIQRGLRRQLQTPL